MALLLFCSLFAQNGPEEGLSTRILTPSGVRLILCPRPQASTVAVAAGFRVGSAFDGAATCGCAHLLEHVMTVRGTELSSTDQIARKWRSLGAAPNGCTYPDFTLFSVSVPPDAVNSALELLRELLLHPVFSASELARERDVVIAELATAAKDPFLQAYRLAVQTLYGEDNYGLPVFGYPRVLKELSANTLYARFDEEYTPGRLSLAVVGPISPELLASTVEETFGSYDPGKRSAPEAGDLRPSASPERAVEKSPARSAQLVFAFPGPPSGSKDWLAFVVMAEILCGGEGTRLWERLVYQDGVARSVRLLVEPRVRGGFALFHMILDPKDLVRCEREVRRVLARTGERPIDPTRIERAMNRIRLDFAQRAETPESLARELIRWDMLAGVNFPLNVRANLAQVTTEQLRRIGQLYFAPRRAKVVAVVPEGFSPPSPGGEGVVRRERRIVHTPFPLVAQSLPNAKLFSFALTVWGGLAADRVGQEGLGGLVARSILRGERGESAETFTDRLLRWGVKAEAGTKRDYTFIRFSAPEGDFEDALDGISRAVLNPDLENEKELERTRQTILAETLSFPTVAQAAEKRLWERAFTGTPYAVVPPGTTSSIEALKVRLRVKARRYWERWWRPENFAVAVTGPRPVDELVVLVQRAFAPFAQYTRGTRWPIEFPLPPLEPQTVVIDRELDQAVLLEAWFAPESTVDNLVTFLLLREILVGGPGARLWKLREEHGLLYHLTGKVEVTRRVLELQLLMILPVKKVKTARELLKQEFERLTVDLVDPEELEFARRGLEQNEARRRERGLSLVEEEAWFLLAGWTREDFQTQVASETPQSLRSKIRKFFRDSNMWTLVVGPKEILTPQLEGR